MAINLNQRYSSDNAPTSPDYPFGRGINAVNDQDETSLPFDMDWFNDWSGFFQAVLMAANITPSGTSDTARTSQYLAALRVLFPDQTEADLRYARRSQNLSDLASVTTARTNLGLGGAALFNVGTAGGELPTTNQADQRYTRRSENLSDLANAATARTNLGVSSTVEADARYLNESSNLSDLDDPATARTNLAVLSTTEADARYLVEANNLSDLTNDETARTNLDVYSRSESDARYLNESSNLSDLPSVSTARTNLGVSSTTEADARYLVEANNLSDLTNAATARTNLQLGTAAQAQVNQFIYPNNGLVGSIEKSDLFTTPATVANQFTIRARTYNINGQFVPIAQTTITLAAAESTAARAVAFDDLFVESDGTYRHVRSINARRTTTGFDADQIATDAGYTRVSQGLYSRGGNHALLLGRITRRNQGAYEPQLNPEGSAEVENISLPSADNVWYVSDRDLTSTQDAFTFQGTGNRGNLNSTGGRPDDLLYDGITTNDITPLYFSARAVTDRKALLFDNFNRAVAGETFMGAEGTTSTRFPEQSAFRSNVINYTPLQFTGVRGTFGGVVEGSATVFIGSFFIRDSVLRITKLDNAGGSSKISFFRVTVNGQNYESERISTGGSSVLLNVPAGEVTAMSIGNDRAAMQVEILKGGLSLPSASPQFLYVDIIGALTAMPQEWLDNGIPGNWLAVDEDGGSLIPDGTAKEYKASRRVLEAYLVLQTDDRGATWSDVTNTYETTLEQAGNTLGSQTFTATRALMIFYRQIAANPFELAGTDFFLEISRNPLAINGSENASDSLIGVLTERMINKVPVSSTSSSVSDSEATGFTYYGRNAGPTVQRQRLFGNRNIHQAFDFRIGSVNPNAKHLPMLVDDTEILYLQMVYKELHWNGTSWGDDNRFNIVDNQSTVTDTNGETVIVGQKRVALPYHFDGDLY